MTPSIPVGEVRLLGDRAFLIGVADAAAARALAGELTVALAGGSDAADAADAAEVVCGAATVLVHATAADAELGPLLARAETVCHDLSRRGPSLQPPPTPGIVTIPCRFDGPDLDEVATLVGCRPDEVVKLLTAQPLTVAVVGFSPGFAYLEGLPPALRAVPRRSRPRPVVPAGSVAIANGHAAVYPTASPGGWHVLGRTGFPLFTAERPPYAVLAPGDRIRFTVAAAGERTEPEPLRAPRWSPPATARVVFEVVAPGLRAVVQDGGRRNVAAVGVPAAGPADPVSFALANRLAGNETGAGTLELTGGGTRLRCLTECHVAVVGAAPDVRVDGTAELAGQLLPLRAGQVLDVGRQRAGCRSYLSVAGGILGPEWFDSSGTDELTGLGAGPLAAGDVVRAGAWGPPLGDHVLGRGVTDMDASSVVELRVLPGPHAEKFNAAVLARLDESVFVVQPDSNRVGLRLRSAAGVPAWRDGPTGGGLDSQGVVTGTVQVPPDGDPVVLMTDHATLGGYPVVAVVVAADHGLLGQCAPGTQVRLVPIGLDEADEARRAARRELARAVAGPYPLAVD
jgi:KipI family sensor histidine kinase inhibitor